MRCLFLALSVLLGCACCAPFHATVTLPSYDRSLHQITCTVTITNRGTRNLFLYHRNTPLEGLKSDIFKIERNGSPVPYDGFFFKRSQVTLFSDRIFLKTNESTTVNLDLSTGYSFTSPGRYFISLNTIVYFSNNDKSIEEVRLQSSPATFTLHESHNIGMTLGEKHRLDRSKFKTEIKDDSKVTGMPKTVNFLGQYKSPEDADAQDAWTKAYGKVVKSISDIPSNPNHYKTWFGTAPQSVPLFTFTNLKNAMEGQTFYIYFRGKECEKGDFAYTYYGSSVIYVCTGFIDARDHDYDTKFGTIVHELTHAIAGTKDIAYGISKCQNLAINKPSDAVNNADNYEYFVESL